MGPDVTQRRFSLNRVWALPLLLILASPLSAQAGLGSAGGHTEEGQYRLNYSVGQVFNAAIEQSDVYISQGIQHPFPVMINGIRSREVAGTDSVLVVFPNPVTEELYIHFTEPLVREFQVQLFRMNGELLMQKTFDTVPVRLPMNDSPPGSYLLSIQAGGLPVQTITIIKN